MLKLEDLIPGGKADNLPKEGVDANELKMGITVEMEHTNDPQKAEEIARDHLSETPDYYTRLNAAGLADELHESKIGDVYIEIGETIEELNTVYIKLRGLLDLMRLKSKSPEMRNIAKLDSAIFDLKSIFGDSYDFGGRNRQFIKKVKT